MRRHFSVVARRPQPKIPRSVTITNQACLQFRAMVNTRDLGDRTATSPPAHEASATRESSTGTEVDARIEAFYVRDSTILKRHGGHRNAGYLIETWQNSYLEDGYKTWGWPIYRTCYENEDDWETFKSEFCRLLLLPMRRYFDDKEVKERSKYLSFPFWEDRKQFENASTTKLRTHYREYLASDGPSKAHGISPPDFRERQGGIIQYITCYEFFLVADAASISSVVQAQTRSLAASSAIASRQDPPWINVVEVDWPPRPDPNEEPENRWDHDNGYDPVEGMNTHNVGFHRNAIETLYPLHWRSIEQLGPEVWYSRPPEVTYDD